jgi:tripartite-type tricarboxylate transporter receptor subunit TctC
MSKELETAQIKKLEAEAEKLLADAEWMRAQTSKLNEPEE